MANPVTTIVAAMLQSQITKASFEFTLLDLWRLMIIDQTLDQRLQKGFKNWFIEPALIVSSLLEVTLPNQSRDSKLSEVKLGYPPG
jgi:hypothetical protein